VTGCSLALEEEEDRVEDGAAQKRTAANTISYQIGNKQTGWLKPVGNISF